VKAFFSQHPGGTVTVHFTGEIPWVAFTSLDFSEGANPFLGSCLVDKFIDFDVVAARAARVNAGRNKLELSQPFEQLRTFLVELTLIQGVENLVDQTRYSLTVEVAVGFETPKIAIEIADCVRRNFYPEQQIVMKQTPPRSKGEPADEIEGRWTT